MPKIQPHMSPYAAQGSLTSNVPVPGPPSPPACTYVPSVALLLVLVFVPARIIVNLTARGTGRIGPSPLRRDRLSTRHRDCRRCRGIASLTLTLGGVSPGPGRAPCPRPGPGAVCILNHDGRGSCGRF